MPYSTQRGERREGDSILYVWNHRSRWTTRRPILTESFQIIHSSTLCSFCVVRVLFQSINQPTKQTVAQDCLTCIFTLWDAWLILQEIHTFFFYKNEETGGEYGWRVSPGANRTFLLSYSINSSVWLSAYIDYFLNNTGIKMALSQFSSITSFSLSPQRFK